MRFNFSRPALRNRLAALFLVTILAAILPAKADFSGDYALTPPAPYTYFYNAREIGNDANAPHGKWFVHSERYSDSYGQFVIDTRAAPGTLVLDAYYPVTSFNYIYVHILFTSVAAGSGPLSFGYTLNLANTTLNSASFYLNGQRTPLSAGDGSVSGITLAAGDVFGFYLESITIPRTQSRTILTINNFNAPAVSEPSAVACLGLGLVLAGAARWRRGGAR